jgi:dTDP-4-dehydrorhamnose 3,5-epimerase
MKIINVKQLEISEIKIIKFQKFSDHRGYFSESFRKTDIELDERVSFLHGENFNQINDSYSKAGTIRGLHFQWNPYMSKLVRCIKGKLIDIALDIRKESPTFGKVIAYQMDADSDYGEWIWIPVGFAHGIYLPEDSIIEYMCTGMWSPGNETAISIFSEDIDWSLCSSDLVDIFQNVLKGNPLMSDKDKNGLTLKEWQDKPESDLFIYRKHSI